MKMTRTSQKVSGAPGAQTTTLKSEMSWNCKSCQCHRWKLQSSERPQPHCYYLILLLLIIFHYYCKLYSYILRQHAIIFFTNTHNTKNENVFETTRRVIRKKVYVYRRHGRVRKKADTDRVSVSVWRDANLAHKSLVMSHNQGILLSNNLYITKSRREDQQDDGVAWKWQQNAIAKLVSFVCGWKPACHHAKLPSLFVFIFRFNSTFKVIIQIIQQNTWNMRAAHNME